MENQYKKFHFQELGWLVYFPSDGNEGKYVTYSVTIKKGSQPEMTAKLGEILEDLEFERNYPHTVGYYRFSSGEGADFRPEYLELRIIRCVEDFWSFLNTLDI